MLKNLSISRRLALGFLVVVLSMVGLTAIGVTRVDKINNHLELARMSGELQDAVRGFTV
jgi:CHASE3 domain sensor protein